MTVIYIAKDGKQFNDEFECINYEWLLDHPSIIKAVFLDKEANKLGDFFSEDTYNNVVTIVVPDTNTLRDFCALARYTGFCAYLDIDRTGTWVWNNTTYNFELI